jgi:hypothetical protein
VTCLQNRIVVAAVLSIPVLLSVDSALAYGEGPIRPAAAASTQVLAVPVTLEEVTVSAPGRQENWQSVAITVDALSGEEAAQRGTSYIETLVATIPNLTLNTATYATNTYIRVVGDNPGSPNNEPSAAVDVVRRQPMSSRKRS